MLRIVEAAGYKLALGSVYPSDPIVFSNYLNYLYLIAHIEPGDVIILHDRRWTPPMLDRLLPWMKAYGYESVTLETLSAS